jgi:hypothetical protein
MVTHLFLHILPITIFYLARIVIPREQALLHTLVATVQKTTAWHLQGCAHGVRKKRVKRYKKPVRIDQKSNKTTSKARMYLLPLLFTAFKVGCCFELRLQLLASLQQELVTPSSSRLNNIAGTITTGLL